LEATEANEPGVRLLNAHELIAFEAMAKHPVARGE